MRIVRSPALPGRLVGLALGSLNAAALTIGLVYLLFMGKALGEGLSNVGTASGLALYLLLWVSTVRCTRRFLEEAGLAFLPRRRNFVISALASGATNGFFFAMGVVVVLSWDDVLAAGMAGLVIPLIALMFGAVIGPTVGAAIGLAFGLVDAALIAIAKRLMGVGPVSGEGEPIGRAS